MSPIVIAIAVFIAVAGLIGGVAMLLRGETDGRLEGRLDQLTGRSAPSNGEAANKAGILMESFNAGQGFFAGLVARLGNLGLLFEQADTSLTPAKFFVISGIMAGVGMAGSLLGGLHPGIAPLCAIFFGALPFVWLMFRRRRRFRKFAAQLPGALELMARALRAGHGLASGCHLVGEEMSDPIGKEFNRVFEEQNLGIALDEALDGLTDRIPNLDLKFFATAVILQKQTGGDLSEILDKIGTLIRDRFKIWGQVQALTGEGRLSGIVLLALPPALFLAVYKLNPEYVMVLFTDPLGKKMLLFATVMQVVGALVIRKIVNIKV